MRKVLGRRPSPATVISLVALFVALGGTSYAALVITGKNIKNGSITGKDVKNSTLTGKKIKNRSLTGSDVKTGSLTGKQIAESKLGKVPSAAKADSATTATTATTATNATQLGGQPASAFGKSDRWALIQGTAAGATILAQSGGMSAARIAAGVYNVDVNASVVRVPLSATLNAQTGVGEINAAPCGGTANNPGGVNCAGVNDTTHVQVITANSAGNAAVDRTFYLRIGG
jgi:hypothetical protein